MSKRLLDYDPLTGLMQFHTYDESEDKTYISYEEDVQGLLDRNKEEQNHGHHRMGDGYFAASVPATVQMKWLIEYGIDMANPDHKPAWIKLLNSNEWSHLKRTPFKL